MCLLKTPGVSPDFFHCAPLSTAQIMRFRARGSQAARDLVADVRLAAGRIHWTASTGDGRVQVHKARKDGLPIYRTQTEIRASLDDMVSIFLTTTTADTREVNAIFFPDHVDKVRLYNLTTPTDALPHFYQSISWDTIQPPFRGAVFKPRDWCYIEHMEETTIDGRRAWVRALQHINVAACPIMRGLVRGHHLLSGFVYVETTCPGVLQVIELHHIRPNGSLACGHALTDYFLDKTIKARAADLAAMEARVHAFKLSQLDFVSFQDLVPKHMRTACSSCLASFGLLRKKINCRRCGEVVCGSCSAMWTIRVGGAASSVPICRGCAAECKEPPPANSRSTRSSVWSYESSMSDDLKTKKAANTVESALLSLLRRSADTQQQLATQQNTIMRTLSHHSEQIHTLASTVARVEAKLSHRPRQVPCL
ncbi:Aste57867_24584 [Aphanomyces stellatus]|uniref:Aste57867_24584 protein n=1 Tax=Aphanomyces stellatus TaxID=120398 RepID=A0A485LQR8_9STRA|nr:hypothetical protein As57867_024506 [Aphanomyces stellatus]VFU01223.1 Aste57867_24584 [Aphanomyces stellatus]